jgi:hypothetical protein
MSGWTWDEQWAHGAGERVVDGGEIEHAPWSKAAATRVAGAVAGHPVPGQPASTSTVTGVGLVMRSNTAERFCDCSTT